MEQLKKMIPNEVCVMWDEYKNAWVWAFESTLKHEGKEDTFLVCEGIARVKVTTYDNGMWAMPTVTVEVQSVTITDISYWLDGIVEIELHRSNIIELEELIYQKAYAEI